jgi:hypothetical protein
MRKLLLTAMLAAAPALPAGAQVRVAPPVLQIAVLPVLLAPIAPPVSAFAPALNAAVSPAAFLPAASLPVPAPSSVPALLAATPAVALPSAPADAMPSPAAVPGAALFDGAVERTGSVSTLDSVAAAAARSLPSSPIDKTRRFNAAGTAAGVFAEIGAGQRVADYVFAGEHASKTILTSISAYDKEASNARYGPAARFVSEERLRQMLDKESAAAQEIASSRGVPLFAFADTVATNKGKGQGWMGLRFQSETGGPWNTVVLHAKITDAENLQQHDALGKLGVNLLYGAYHMAGDVDGFIKSLNDNLTAGEIEIDALRFEGPVFAGVDNRLVGLDLLRHGVAASALYDPKGFIVPAYEETWGKSTLIYLKPRGGAAAPIGLLKEKLAREGGLEADKILPVEVVPLDEYREANGFDEARFLADATNPGYVLIVDKMDGQALQEFARRLNTGFSAIALEGPESPSDALIPAAAGGRKAPLATYRYRP